MSFSQLDGIGSSISFLMCKITETEDGLLLTPRTSVEKVVKAFEEKFGVARMQLRYPVGGRFTSTQST